MPMTREQVLSEFIDAWNAGQRPAVEAYIARGPAEEQVSLGEELAAFLTFAPTPEYTDDALAGIRAEIAEVGETSGETGLFRALLMRLRERMDSSTAEVADELVGELGLTQKQAPKTAT